IENVSRATVDSWNKNHASDYSRASLDAEGPIYLDADLTFTKDVRLTKKEFLQQFAREIREFNAFLKSPHR
ncbi:MAG TPA: hypothetical protein VNB29_06825, partial [Chthoniobacterales bacterium]|nr:hypothetical protein [Chthoniobacterales bacterium]